MPSPQRPKSPKERLHAKQTQVLIGREDQQDWFARSLLQPEHRDAKVIFSISGQGGVGKTTLLKSFRQIAEEAGHVAAYVDEGMVTNRVEDVPEALHRLVEDLERQGFKFEKFREQYKAYRVKKQELEADPESPKGLVGDATRGVAKIAIEAGKSMIPMGGMIGSMIDGEMVATKMGEMANYGWERFRNKDEERLMRETQEVLTPLFLEGLRKVAIEKTFVLMLDTYEVTGGFLDSWVRGLLDERFGELERSLLVCIAGRNPIDGNAWSEWESLIARSPLEPFSREQAWEFLGRKGIESEAVRSEIWRLSLGGLPLMLSWMVAVAPRSVDAVVDPCEDAVRRFLTWETEEPRKQLAIAGACARVLDEDVVRSIGEGGLEWLQRYGFLMRDGKRWRYHSVVREAMVRYQWQRSRSEWSSVHGKLAAFYEARRSALGLPVGKEADDRLWREDSLEWIYHRVCAVPQASLGIALNGFLMALKYGTEFAQSWAEAMAQAGKEADCEVLRKWGEQLQDGMIASQEKRYLDVIPCLTAILGADYIEAKMVAVAWNLRGNCYRQLENLELALPDALKAVEIDPEEAKYQFNLGLAFQNLKDYDKAIGSYLKAIELRPKDTKAYNNIGTIYHDQKDYSQAIEYYLKTIEIDPQHSIAHHNLGGTYRAQKDYDQAIEHYLKAIELNPKYTDSYHSLGNTYHGQKDYSQAIECYEKAIELNPQYATAYNNLGATYKAQKEYNKAIECYEKAIELNPQDATAYYNLGATYKDQKEYSKAIECYEKAIELNPQDATAYYNLGNTYKAQKEYNKAIECYEKAIELNPELKQAFANRGEAYRLTKRYEEALKDFDRAIELDNNYAWAIISRGQTCQALKRYEEALQDFDRAIQIEPTSWRLGQRGQIYRELKRYEEALKDFNQATEIEPSEANPYSDLGFLYYELARYTDSIHSFENARLLDPDELSYSICLSYLYLLLDDVEASESILEEIMNDEAESRIFFNHGLLMSCQSDIDKAKTSWKIGLQKFGIDSDWDKAVSYIFTIALGEVEEGLEGMRLLIEECSDASVFRNALNEATILSRSPQPIAGVPDLILLLESKLSE